MTDQAKKRPVFRNVSIFHDLPGYRFPLAAIVSILHRASGGLMFLLLPFVLWMFDVSLASPESYASFVAVFSEGCGFVPGWVIRLVTLALLWAYLHHLFTGLRFLIMDVDHHSVSKEFGRRSAAMVLVLSLSLTALLGAKLFGLY